MPCAVGDDEPRDALDGTDEGEPAARRPRRSGVDWRAPGAEPAGGRRRPRRRARSRGRRRARRGARPGSRPAGPRPAPPGSDVSGRCRRSRHCDARGERAPAEPAMKLEALGGTTRSTNAISPFRGAGSAPAGADDASAPSSARKTTASAACGCRLPVAHSLGVDDLEVRAGSGRASCSSSSSQPRSWCTDEYQGLPLSARIIP